MDDYPGRVKTGLNNRENWWSDMPPRTGRGPRPGRWGLLSLLFILPLLIPAGLTVFSAGAYGMVMSSNYTAMPRPPEVLVSDGQATIIRRRETYDDLVAAELQTSTV